MDAEGRNMRAMTEGDGNNCVPSWSRDGSRFTSAPRAAGAGRYGSKAFTEVERFRSRSTAASQVLNRTTVKLSTTQRMMTKASGVFQWTAERRCS